jgi:hypothetical protein
MATGPALQLTGTQILASARYFAQDQSTAAPAVSDTDGLLRLNDRLVWWQNNVDVRAKTLSATTSGLTFAANDMTKVVTNDTGIVNILSAHQMGTAAITYPMGPRLKRASVEQIYDAYALKPGQTNLPTGAEIVLWAAEMDQTQQDDWRVFIYPAASTTMYLALRASVDNTLGTLADTADVSPAAARVIARLLAYDLAGVQKQNDASFLEWIMSGVPAGIRAKVFGEATKQGAQQSSLSDSGSLSY